VLLVAADYRFQLFLAYIALTIQEPGALELFPSGAGCRRAPFGACSGYRRMGSRLRERPRSPGTTFAFIDGKRTMTAYPRWWSARLRSRTIPRSWSDTRRVDVNSVPVDDAGQAGIANDPAPEGRFAMQGVRGARYGPMAAGPDVREKPVAFPARLLAPRGRHI
jgi:hypothetical protein